MEHKNHRYKHFNHSIFTAGDVDQFESRRIRKNGEDKNEILLTEDDNKFNNMNIFPSWNKYEELGCDCVDNTFNYMYHKFKKGIYVKICDGKLQTFLPFSKAHYVNEWGHKLKATNRFNKSFPTEKSNVESLLTYCNRNMGFNIKFYHNKIFDKQLWFANNCLIRYEYPIKEGESGVLEMKDMLEDLCRYRKLPDIEFFINRRDFPLLRLDEKESYDKIFGENTPLLSHNYTKYCPILSMTTTDKHSDIPIPTWDDWCRISQKSFTKVNKSNIDTLHTIRKFSNNCNTSWVDKIEIAVFRGASTGCGINEHTNMRLKISLMSKQRPDLINAGITKWNLRPRITNTENKLILDTIDINKYQLVEYMTPEEQSKYKYIVNINGHSSAFRLSSELAMKSVILLVESKYKLWFTDYLKPYVHYVPIKGDLSDLEEKIMWCRDNDVKCKEISINARDFYDEYLCEDGVYDYLQKLFVEMSKGYYKYPEKSRIELQEIEQQKLMEEYRINIEYDILNDIKHNVYKIRDKEGNILIKKSGNIINETFIGIKCVNELCKEIPNFMNTIGWDENNIYLENIEGQTLYDWIQKEFDINVYIRLLKQIKLVLDYVYKKYKYIHNDLTPWNIILKKQDKEIEIKYGDKSIKTDIICVFIDYGKSSCIVDKKELYIYRNNRDVDMMLLLYKSVSNILTKYRVNNYEKDIILKMFGNVFSNLYKLKEYLSKYSNYDYILFGTKTNVETTIIKQLIKFIN